MVEQDGVFSSSWPPIGAPLLNVHKDEHWKHFDNSVNAVSFGFVATAILISMFLVMAIFERFIRPNSGTSNADLEAQIGFNAKLAHPSPKVNDFGSDRYFNGGRTSEGSFKGLTVYANEVSVLMPGDSIPTFIAHPVPVPCRPERVSRPHRHNTNPSFNQRDNSNARPDSSSTRV